MAYAIAGMIADERGMNLLGRHEDDARDPGKGDDHDARCIHPGTESLQMTRPVRNQTKGRAWHGSVGRYSAALRENPIAP